MKKLSITQLVNGISDLMSKRKDQRTLMTSDTANGCVAFVQWYEGQQANLPINPVALLLTYESYQTALASEASGIECLPEHEMKALRAGVRCATIALYDAVGGTPMESADCISLMAKGIAEHIARRLSE